MKFKCTVDIGKPVDQVIELWQNTDNLSEWQEGFISFEHLEGEPGTVGAKSKMMYKSPDGQFELIETIIANNLPWEFKGRYEAKTMVNTMTNNFVKLDDHHTRWNAEIEYTEFNGLMPKLLGMFGKSMFRKQTQKWLNNFKAFAEKK